MNTGLIRLNWERHQQLPAELVAELESIGKVVKGYIYIPRKDYLRLRAARGLQTPVVRERKVDDGGLTIEDGKKVNAARRSGVVTVGRDRDKHRWFVLETGKVFEVGIMRNVVFVTEAKGCKNKVLSGRARGELQEEVDGHVFKEGAAKVRYQASDGRFYDKVTGKRLGQVKWLLLNADGSAEYL